MDSCHTGIQRVGQYALVGYVPGALGKFLDRLRTELVAGCHLQSHVTVLPPRALIAPEPLLITELGHRLERQSPVEISLGSVEIFPSTQVIYLGLKHGQHRLAEMHGELSPGDFAFQEHFPFHPHLTLAQQLLPEAVESALARAQAAWEAWDGPRSFLIEELTFVRCVEVDVWKTLSAYSLSPVKVPKTA